MVKRKRTNNDLQNRTQKKDRATRIPLKTRGDPMYSGWISNSCSTCDTRRATNPL